MITPQVKFTCDWCGIEERTPTGAKYLPDYWIRLVPFKDKNSAEIQVCDIGCMIETGEFMRPLLESGMPWKEAWASVRKRLPSLRK